MLIGLPNRAEGLGLPPYAPKGLVNHKQPNIGVTGGNLKLPPKRLRIHLRLPNWHLG
jgi:hypothetical protein